MLRITLSLILFVQSAIIISQKITISGVVEDGSTGERLLGAFVLDSLNMKGTSTNYYGFYSISLPAGQVKLVFSFVGYNITLINTYLTRDTSIDIKLFPKMMDEVIVTTARRNVIGSPQMGLIQLSSQQIKNLPTLMGEADIIKTIQLLPGVKGGTEGTSGLYVRGGAPDQNLILLDGVPVYNPNHLFGFFSVFNSNAIQSFTLLKGGFPARYGGRLSSVVDIKMKEGNSKNYSGIFSIGLLSSTALIEGPIKTDTTSFIVSARRTYLDVIPFIILKIKGEDEMGGYYFYDINAKINHKFSNQSRLYYSIYTGEDKFYYNIKNSLSKINNSSGWGNSIHALRWNYVFTDQLFANFTGTFSNYKFFIRSSYVNKEKDNDRYFMEYSSGIRDWGTKADFDYIPSTSHYIRFGGSYIYHHFNPGITAIELKDEESLNIDTAIGNYAIYAHEYSAYIEDEFDINNYIKINAGGHFSFFKVKGSRYFSIQPRVGGRWLINPNLSFKGSIVQMKQYIQLLTSANIGLPTDLWVPCTNKISPLEAWQYSVGLTYSPSDEYEITLETYYKEMNNIIEYKEGASLFSYSNNWEDKVEKGKGWSRGIEILILRKMGEINGWIGYTLSKTDRQFENISFGKRFPYKYDIRHAVSVALILKTTSKTDVGVTWQFSSGTAATLGEQQIAHPQIYQRYYYFSPIEYIGQRNNYRMPAYHRLDINLNFNKNLKRGSRTFTFGIYNVYNRKNPFFILIEKDLNNPSKNVIKQYSLFPILPYLSFTYKF